MRKTSAWYVMIALAVFGTVLRGQDEDLYNNPRLLRQEVLDKSLDQINIVVSMDRTTSYFPGEAATVTVRLTNSTAAPLEILDPRAAGMASFAYSRQGGEGTKDKSAWPEFAPPMPPWNDLDPTTTLQPGQSITMTFPPDASVRPSPTFKMVPTYPGDYRIRFRLGGEAEFQVGAPILEASAVVPLQEFKTYQERGMKEPETVQDAAMIVAVRLNGEHLLFAAQHNVSTTREVKAEKDGTLKARGGEPWIRLATVPSKVTRLNGTADPSGQITLEYTTQDGGGGKVYLDKSRHPL